MGSWRSGSASASHAEGHRFEPCTAHHLENPASGGVFYWGGKRANCFARGSVRKPQRCASLRKQGEHREAGLRAARVNEPTCRRTLYCPPFREPRIRRGFFIGAVSAQTSLRAAVFESRSDVRVCASKASTARRACERRGSTSRLVGEPCTAHHLLNPALGGVFYWGGKRANFFARGSAVWDKRTSPVRPPAPPEKNRFL